ncbi:TetR family transcriptional regulator [Mycobacterium sp. ST-F2]|uniref:TetR/AcrR family transcriptional regulator n=1 Tax=Mycobacterium sp. ST-F2 TaxID=1490484 RepID=UPI00093C020E|nr:TetR/AcrR family transcriptional regulator [Mycobacterium sp. ST-F2]OKH81633.1 TetR family transcriptional regulator [Mycobacterium sp. ST-F2]
MPSGQRQGRWSTVPLADRPTRRREALIDAGIAALGHSDGPSATVRAVCRAAGLTERYFYESFTDRDDFVRAVYDEVCTTAMAALTSSQGARDAVERFVTMMVDDPTRGRVLLIAPAQEPVLTRSGAAWMPSFIELLQHKMFPDSDPTRRALEATSLIGALTALFTGYLGGKLPVTREQFVDYCVDMLMSRIPAHR